MPIPPNFRLADETVPKGLIKSCNDCRFLSSDEYSKFLCIKYRAYVTLGHVCDSYEDIHKLAYPQNMRVWLNKQEIARLRSLGIVDLQNSR